MKHTSNLSQEAQQLTDAMEIILENVNQEGIIDSCLEKIREELDLVNATFGTTDIQSILFIAILEESFEAFSSIKSLTRTLGISNIKFLGLKPDINVLLSKRFIRETKGRRDNISYKVPISAIKAIQEGKCPNCEDITNISTREIFRNLFNIFKEIHNEGITPETGQLEIRELMIHNLKNDFVKKTERFGISRMTDQEQVLAFYLLHRLETFGEDHFTRQDFVKLVFEDEIDPEKAFPGIDDGTSPLFTNHIIEFMCDEGQVDDTVLVLTDEAKHDLMKGIITNDDRKDAVEEIVPCDELIKALSIREKELFYNSEEEAQILRLENLLQEENFEKVRDRLEEKGLSRGFTALFYGAPGTGKTASVFELARRSGRDIYFVDQSKLRSKWHGESEKALKSLFTNYRKLVRTAGLCPILVLNECDSIMNKRSEQTDSVNGELNNSMVNIVLNELDDFEGILIATSNLAEGMDPAFERRLLFKVQFNKPGEEVREKIWASKIDGLEEEELTSLAREYTFSGGQIDNIARKVNIDYILSGEAPTMESIDGLCENEKIRSDKTSRIRIGF